MVIINVKTSPQRFSYQSRPIGFLIFEGGKPIAYTTEETFAKIIVQALNSWFAILGNMPIKLGNGSGHARN